MTNDMATTITAIVIDQNEKEAFVQKNGITYKIISDNDVTIGDTLKGFVYTDKQDNAVFTTEIPEINKDTFGWGTVVKVNRKLGVFVDVGWQDKDVVVSMDDLPAEGRLWPREGDVLFLSIKVDDKKRIWGDLADEEKFFAEYIQGTKDMHNQDLLGTVFHLKKSGTYLITEDKNILFVHPSERDKEPRLGQNVSCRVVGIREDGVLYASMQPRAHEVIEDDALMLLEMLKRSEDGSIPFHNKTDPEEIKKQFGISKGQFKRAVGRLMKKNFVYQDEEGTKLKEDYKEDQDINK
ncbi:MAG: S1-like domain-containing RNA-binding protein [Alkalibacterium sp.]|uniref:S1-like domain-containing RNA-binding protein n=1 Tax=Alkalibacterium sp. TaxID=1872447 RepID=UPI0026485D14|nr:S1-like domain-containing RNA-binding protein [Alkalibacterium sp.]MDN6295406.1 S1-like domain-containing RNA-binding protein [Alkalibacterium sp.]